MFMMFYKYDIHGYILLGLTKKRQGAPESVRDNKIAPGSARGAKIVSREIIYVSFIEIC